MPIEERKHFKTHIYFIVTLFLSTLPIHSTESRNVTTDTRRSLLVLPAAAQTPESAIGRILTSPTSKTKTLQSTKVVLGQTLFFDKRLSSDGTLSCAVCHDPAMAFAGKEPIAVGIERGTRNAPSLFNVAFASSYFWDGRVHTLEEQAKQPLLNQAEMGMMSEALLVQRISSIKYYQHLFRKVFREPDISLDMVASAIAEYERTLVSADSPFDRFIAGNANAMTNAQKRGWELFKSKARCIQCHLYTRRAPFFTDFNFHNTGVGIEAKSFEAVMKSALSLVENDQTFDIGGLAHQPQFSELGRFLVTRKLQDMAAFKTPTMRNIELTGPYMHDGSLPTLLDVVRFYNRGGVSNRMLDQKVKPLELSEKEMNDLVDFLRALTSDDVLRLVQSSRSQTRERVVLPN